MSGLIPNKPGERRGGRKKGVPNKTTQALKDMILGALDDAGGRAYLLRQAKDNPGPFLALIGKILPKEVNAEVSGPDGGPLQLQHMTTAELDARLNELLAKHG